MNKTTVKQSETNALRPFVHLHTHTEYSLSDGLSKIDALVEKAMADGMPGMAITDHANMFGVCEFVECVNRKNAEKNTNFRPIIGCEFYVARRGMEHKSEREDFAGYHLVLLAKNYNGYRNLIKLVSRSWTEGFCGRPRTDRADLERYHEGLICTSACIGGEVAQHIINDRLAEAELSALWYKNLFGEDFYLEMQRHKATVKRANHDIFELEERVNKELLSISKRLGIKLICANDAHFVNEEDAEVQDTLLCVNWKKKYDDSDRLVFSKQEWLKTTAEMNALFADIPEALDNTIEILNKVECFSLSHDPIWPRVTLPEGVDEVEQLARLTFEGAHKRFGERLPDEVKERLKSELREINRHSFPVYFLLWHEIVTVARELGARLAPGRAATACSLVAYCLGFTEINPLRWGLLFERFLATEKRAIPPISIELDNYGREQLLRWIKERFGADCVANIVAFNSFPRFSAHEIVGSVYSNFSEKRQKALIPLCERLEGVKKSASLNSCSLAICGEPIAKRVPMAVFNDRITGEPTLATQYDSRHIANLELLKIEILSNFFLDVVNRTLGGIRYNSGVEVDLQTVPIDDAKTLELFRMAETIGIFQFDSPGIQSVLRDLQLTKFEELVAINALYRPGPMDYIPEYIERKNGKCPIDYINPEVEAILGETYGLVIYQEQMMQLFKSLAGFTPLEADRVRKAFVVRNYPYIDKLHSQFVEGGIARGYSEDEMQKVWRQIYKFAPYNFLKAHAVSTTWLAFQTAYLKTHYPAEYMEALLYTFRHIDYKHELYLKEARRMGL